MSKRIQKEGDMLCKLLNSDEEKEAFAKFFEKCSD